MARYIAVTTAASTSRSSLLSPNSVSTKRISAHLPVEECRVVVAPEEPASVGEGRDAHSTDGRLDTQDQDQAREWN
eukprot:3225495-Rhodomonas_salina.3